MNWKRKALYQNLVALLPAKLSYAVYYFIQRKFGDLRTLDPKPSLLTGRKILDHIHRQGQTVQSKSFLEVGTGRRLNVPIALWLCGASRVITVDLNPYLKAELVREDVSYIKRHQSEIRGLFGKYAEEPVFQEQFQKLVRANDDFDSLLEMMHIQYVAPADATRLDLPSQSVDYHFSNVVLQYVPLDALKGLLREGKRLLRKDGLSIHFIDCSDNFMHSDEAISSINFLQFSERQWTKYAGNRYVWHNRLRVDDYPNLFAEAGLRIASINTHVDQRALEALRAGFPLDQRFKGHNAESIATDLAWIVTTPH